MVVRHRIDMMMRALLASVSIVTLLLQHVAPLAVPRSDLVSSRRNTVKTTTAAMLLFHTGRPPWHGKSQRVKFNCQQESILYSQVTGKEEPKQKRKRRKRKTWDEYKQELVAFKSAEGHCRVPPGHAEYPSLANWLSTQRKNYRLLNENRPSPLTRDQFRELDEIGVVWAAKTGPTSGNGKKRNNELWNKRLEELKSFQAATGHCHVPQEFPDNPALGKWVSHQRFQYRRYQSKKSSLLDEDRIRALEEIGFEWTPKRIMRIAKGTYNSMFDNHLEELKGFRLIHGHCRVPYGDPKTYALANWVSHQRQKYRLILRGKASPLTPAQILALDELGFEWEVERQKRKTKPYKTWSRRLAELKAFKDQYGHCQVFRAYRQDQGLCNWTVRQRQLYRSRKSELTPERIRQLEEIGFEWETSRGLTKRVSSTWDEIWNERFAELVSFKERHGHCRVPPKYYENMRLGRWVVRQRELYRIFHQNQSSTITPERIRKLENIGFEFDITRRDEQFNERLNDLMQFRAQNGHCRVPRYYTKNKSLANWVCSQKQNFRLLQRNEPSSLTPERIRALEDAGFDFGKIGRD